MPDQPGAPVTVMVRNASQVPQYVQVGYRTRSPEVRFIPAGQDAPLPTPGNCDGTCEQHAEGVCHYNDGPCGVAEILRLAPGATALAETTATRYVPRELPESCPGSSLCQGDCIQEFPLLPGAYTLAIIVGSGPDCAMAPCDSCQPYGEETCVYDGNFWLLDPRLVGVPFSQPGAEAVEIVLE